MLSQARAMVVRQYLVENFKIDDTRIKTKGMGEDRGVDERQANRVEIIVYSEDDKPAAKDKKPGKGLRPLISGRTTDH